MIENLFKERKEKIRSFQQLIGKKKKLENKEAPDGLYTSCVDCQEMFLTKTLRENQYVCPRCGYHFKIGAYTRLNMVFDQGKYKELFKGMKLADPLHFPGYQEKLEKLQKKTDLEEAVVVGDGKINQVKTVVVAMDTRFLMGSMGSVVGEKITRLVEKAIQEKLPVILFCVSGGARMQEGIISLMQMAKTSSAIAKLDEAGLLYVSVLTDPTTGGVTASFASLGDIILAEPGALIGFAGPRVIEQTIKQKLPKGFQSAEFLLKHGFIDKIVERKNMKNTLYNIVKMHQKH